ncbi:hypothetical protein AM587_10003975 [Phytophthora nicotianae]|uniref:Uncharacterized protein n=1 Tax=Phytophthora nicotianae TaxID=4792 RepID=A0A0W8DVE4_PHYNI|nr:hypothetical protein AM587_10003975 [Phytophthora nicotianae]
MSRDAIDAVPRAAADAPAQEDMRDESPLGGGSVIANEQVIAESGGEQDPRSAGDDARQAVERGGSLISQTEDPGGRNMNVKASEHMDVEDGRNTKAARSSEMDGDGEDAGSQNTSDAASVTVDSPPSQIPRELGSVAELLRRLLPTYVTSHPREGDNVMRRKEQASKEDEERCG